MIVTTIIIGLLIVTVIVGRVNLSFQFNNQVKQLFFQSKNTSDKKFYHEHLVGLPEPVQRYFKHVLKEGQPYISYVRITHDGLFKTGLDKGWIKIHGEQYATTGKPGFIWKGVTSMFTARDMYIKDKGRLVVTLFSLINIVDGMGAQYDQGELLRWLGESVMYPTALLPGDNLAWTEIDVHSAKLTFNYMGLSLFFIASINDAGEIVQLETQRYMDKTHLEKWVIKIAKYKAINGVVVPTCLEVLWRLQKGDFSYAKFNIRKVEYGNPKMF